MRMRQGPRHEDKKRAEGRSTREEIVDVTSDGKCCGVEITETCVREGSEAGVKGAQCTHQPTEIPRMGRTGRLLGGNFTRFGSGRNPEGKRSLKEAPPSDAPLDGGS